MIRPATWDDVSAVCNMMDSQRHLGDIFCIDPIQFVKEHIKSTWMVDVDHVPAAYLLCRVPEIEEDNLGYDIGLTDTSQLKKVVHMESCVVLPEYRGNHFMLQLLRHVIPHYTKEGFTRIMATVHPDNGYSRCALEAAGLTCVMEKVKYGGVPRCIMLKEV